MRLLPLLLLCGFTFTPVEPGPINGDCRSACERMRELSCPEADDLDGVTCEDDCNAALKEATMNPRTACLTHIESCGDIPGCYE